MTDLRKAAEMALKFCEDIGELGGPYPYVNRTGIVSDSRKVSQALRQALAQPEWVGLTDEERADCWSSSAVQSAINIEAKLKEKNA